MLFLLVSMLFNFKLFKRIYISFVFLVGILLVGTLGYVVLIEDMTFIDAFFMTLITVTTVGFGEPEGGFTTEGKIFTSFLIFISFGTFAYAVGSITQYLVGGEYQNYFKYYKVNQAIQKLDNHVIICGYGRNGQQAARTLKAYKQPYIVIENKESLIELLKRNKEFYVQGDARLEENMIKAGIERSTSLITTLPTDADNVFVVLTAREMNKKIRIISRASADSSDQKLRIAGADTVIMPEKVGGAHMAETVMSPDLLEFIDHISVQGPASVNLEELNFGNLPEEYRNKSIRELDAGYKTGARIIGFKTPAGKFIINPSPDTVIEPGSRLFVLGSPDQIRDLNKILGVSLS